MLANVSAIFLRICFQSDLTMEITQGIFHQHEAKIEAIMDFQHGYEFDAIWCNHVLSCMFKSYIVLSCNYDQLCSCIIIYLYHVLSNTRSKTISLQFPVEPTMSQMLYEWLCCLTFFQPRRLILRVNSRHQTDLKQHEHTIVLLESFRHDRFRVPDGHMDPYMVNSLFWFMNTR